MGLLSENYSPFDIRQEKFQDQDVYLELRDLVRELEAFREDVVTCINDEVGFHDRGDPTGHDFDVDDFTTDNTWNDLDLSSIVPVGAKAVLLEVYIKDDAVNTTLEFRENGNSNDFNTTILRTQVANVFNIADMIVASDVNRVIEYRGSDLAFVAIYVAVRGWWK